ncbi:tRNA (guanosine(37)-N1)-methyltransferase TrmD [Hirschia maritima]|uniref:tRNA (guanosine(37)-N1)-methyltransferase TrmD n=1 Tax=Hirschia maritima TaxID=1121961 RepID=UPI00036DF093|nr:tRNA (guanosine(37)-N1)-methyltransferase TrmD [Hirschia maritima]
MSFDVTFLTLFPEAFPGILDVSIIGRARKQGIWSCETVDIREFGEGKHRQVDDTPAGGGAGMVLRPDIMAKAIDSVDRKKRPLIYMSPRGPTLKQEKVRELVSGPGMIILCGRFEGLDQRVIDEYEIEEISIGDFILAGGEVAAQTMAEACIRLLPDVAGNEESLEHESFETGLLEHPHYTKPRTWKNRPTPDVLLSGDHKKIDKWRLEESLALTKARRPDLYASFKLNLATNARLKDKS